MWCNHGMVWQVVGHYVVVGYALSYVIVLCHFICYVLVCINIMYIYMHPNAPCVFGDVDREKRNGLHGWFTLRAPKQESWGFQIDSRNAGQGMSSLIMLLKCVQDTWQRAGTLCVLQESLLSCDPLRWHVFFSNIQRYISSNKAPQWNIIVRMLLWSLVVKNPTFLCSVFSFLSFHHSRAERWSPLIFMLLGWVETTNTSQNWLNIDRKWYRIFFQI